MSRVAFGRLVPAMVSFALLLAGAPARGALYEVTLRATFPGSNFPGLPRTVFGVNPGFDGSYVVDASFLIDDAGALTAPAGTPINATQVTLGPIQVLGQAAVSGLSVSFGSASWTGADLLPNGVGAFQGALMFAPGVAGAAQAQFALLGAFGDFSFGATSCNSGDQCFLVQAASVSDGSWRVTTQNTSVEVRAVPEPATVGMIAAGLLLLGWRRVCAG
jgi:hypothetical protein